MTTMPPSPSKLLVAMRVLKLVVKAGGQVISIVTPFIAEIVTAIRKTRKPKRQKPKRRRKTG